MERLTAVEVLSLFGRGPEETRWLNAADSAEWLAIISYLVQRPCRHP